MEFHRHNPHIILRILKIIDIVKAKGMRSYSMNAIFERIRWQQLVRTSTSDGFKLNNNHRAYYTRVIDDNFPEHRGFLNSRATQ